MLINMMEVRFVMQNKNTTNRSFKCLITNYHMHSNTDDVLISFWSRVHMTVGPLMVTYNLVRTRLTFSSIFTVIFPVPGPISSTISVGLSAACGYKSE